MTFEERHQQRRRYKQQAAGALLKKWGYQDVVDVVVTINATPMDADHFIRSKKQIQNSIRTAIDIARDRP